MKRCFALFLAGVFLLSACSKSGGPSAVSDTPSPASSSVSSRTDEEEMRTLQTAVMRGITHCYAIEGTYPDSLEYLIENYGLIYDEGHYYIDYQPLGSNLMPDVTIIQRED